MLRNATLLLVSTLALAAGGCGDDEKDPSGGAATSTPAAAEATGASTHEAVLACLQDEGLDAKDQSTSTGEKIGIDYPEGRLVISFEDTELDAETYASVAETNGEKAVVNGAVVISAPVGGDAEVAVDTADGCVGSSG